MPYFPSLPFIVADDSPAIDPLSPLAAAAPLAHRRSPSDLPNLGSGADAGQTSTEKGVAESTENASAAEVSGAASTGEGVPSSVVVTDAVESPMRKPRDALGGVRSTSVPPEAQLMPPQEIFPRADGSDTEAPFITECAFLSFCFYGLYHSGVPFSICLAFHRMQMWQNFGRFCACKGLFLKFSR